MGATQSYMTPQMVVTGAVVIGAVGFGYQQITAGSSSSSDNARGGGGSLDEKKGKGKKKSSGGAAAVGVGADTAGTATPTVVPFPAVIPGQFDAAGSDEVDAGTGSGTSVVKGKKGKKRKGGKATPVAVVQAEKEEKAKADDESSPLVSSTPGPVVSESVVEESGAPSTTTKSKKSRRQRKQQNQNQSQSTLQSSTSGAKHSPSVPEPNSGPQAKAKAKAHTAAEPSSAELQQSVASLATDTDGEWTRVSRRGDKKNIDGAGAVSDAGQYTTASVTTETSSSAEARTEEEDDDEGENDEAVLGGAAERQPLAKRLLPKPRKTGVEDMLATPDYATYSRVMRVQPGPGEKPAKGFSWGDYEDVSTGPSGVIGRTGTGGSGFNEGEADADADGEDDGWGVVKRSGRSKQSPSSSFTQASSSLSSAPETITKRQRQNAAKREAQKTAKVEAEKQRLATLQRHKRELEKVRIEEQYSVKSGKAKSGGMNATVDDRGKLVWD